MIDTSHLAYLGVLMVFLIGAITVALFAALFLAAGSVIALAVRLSKASIRQKPDASAQVRQDTMSHTRPRERAGQP